MLARLGLSKDQRLQIERSVHYAKELERPYAEVPRLLESLASRFYLGVIANQSIGTEERLVRWGIRDYFSLLLASAEFGLSKPATAIFAAARSRAGVQPDALTMVGDRIDNDIGPANAHGWKTVRVLQGFSRLQRHRTVEEQPDITIAKIAELADIHSITMN